MKIVFIINDIATESPNYSTPLMAYTAVAKGHEVYMAGVGDLTFLSDGHIGIHAYKASEKKYKTSQNFFNALREDKDIQFITSKDLDVIFLRNNPPEDLEERPWAQTAGLVFGQLACRKGVIVLNDPNSISDANDKIYLHHFPEIVYPETIITRNTDDIKNFYKEHKKKIVLKPLQGSGGKDVFLLKKDETNLNQIVEAIARNGYVIAQAYLPDAKNGDVRVFMMNGNILKHKGKYALFRRVNDESDFRSNLHAGGKPQQAKLTKEIEFLAETIGPKLKQDGIFLVGLDVVGDKLMEMNVFSPGGLHSARKLEEVNFAEAIIESIEKKVHYKKLYNGQLSNQVLASMD